MKLYGYVAKDWDMGGKTCLYLSQPIRDRGVWLPKSGDPFESLPLPDEAFPNLQWKDAPVRVEIIVKPVRKRLKRKLGVFGR
jgi:hypothetical protein